MKKRKYEMENRDAEIAQIAADGNIIIEDVTIDLDENNLLTNCYFMVEDMPEPGEAAPTEIQDALEALALLGIEPEEEE